MSPGYCRTSRRPRKPGAPSRWRSPSAPNSSVGPCPRPRSLVSCDGRSATAGCSRSGTSGRRWTARSAEQQLFVRRLRDVSRDVNRLATTLHALERDPPVRIPSRLGQAAPRNPLDRCVPAGGTGQVFAVTVREDELEGFRGPVLLDATTSHFQDSTEGLEWGIYARPGGRANDGVGVLTAAPLRGTLARERPREPQCPRLSLPIEITSQSPRSKSIPCARRGTRSCSRVAGRIGPTTSSR